jgi:hypothetical protein
MVSARITCVHACVIETLSVNTQILRRQIIIPTNNILYFGTEDYLPLATSKIAVEQHTRASRRAPLRAAEEDDEKRPMVGHSPASQLIFSCVLLRFIAREIGTSEGRPCTRLRIRCVIMLIWSRSSSVKQTHRVQSLLAANAFTWSYKYLSYILDQILEISLARGYDEFMWPCQVVNANNKCHWPY